MYLALVVIAIFFYIFVYTRREYDIEENNERNRDRLYLSVFFIATIFIMGLRSVDVGADTINYSRKFNEISLTSWKKIFESLDGVLKYNGLEIGYVITAKVTSLIIDDYIFSVFACIDLWIIDGIVF